MGDFSIRKFDLSKIKDHKTIVIVGRRGTGKTTLITDILYHKRKLPAGLVVSGTEAGNGYYRKFVPDSFIYEQYDEDVIKRLIDRQTNLKKLKAKHSDCFLLLDDCLFKPSIMRSETMRFLFMNGRHFSLMVVLAAQYLMDIPAAVRSNTDYIFVFNDPILANRKRFYDHYFGIFASFAEFQAVYQSCTADFDCLVLDNTVQSSNPQECCFWYKADVHKPFKIGAPEYWRYHKTSYGHKTHGEDDDKVTMVNGVRVRKTK
jgi:hypothetical protein